MYRFSDGGVLEVEVGVATMDSTGGKTLLTPVRLRWLLGVLLDFERATGDARVHESTETTTRAAFKSPAAAAAFSTAIDWDSFLAQPEFLALTPEAQSGICGTLTGRLVTSVLRGLAAVCEHPIGLKCVQDNVASLRVSFAVTGRPAPPRESLTVAGRDLVLRTSDVSLAEAAGARYKERIEFAYDLVVAIAVDNATPSKAALEAALRDAAASSSSSSAHGGGGGGGGGGAAAAAAAAPPLSFRLDVPLEFTRTDTFRAIEPPRQADIITCLWNLPALVGRDVHQDRSGVIATLQHAPVVAALRAAAGGASEVVVTVRVHVEPPAVASRPSWVWAVAPGGGGLTLDVALDDVLAMPGAPDWTPRALDCLGLVEVVGRLETDQAREALWHATTQALGGGGGGGGGGGAAAAAAAAAALDFTLEIDWDTMVASPQYRELTAAQRLAAVKSLQTDVVRALFHGDAGVTGVKGLREFQEVADAVTREVRRVVLAVTPGADEPCAVDAAANGGSSSSSSSSTALVVLRVRVGLPNVRAVPSDAARVHGVANAFETVLNLRPVRQAAAVARGAQRVAEGCGAVPLPVQVDWDQFVASPQVTGDQYGCVVVVVVVVVVRLRACVRVCVCACVCVCARVGAGQKPC